MDLKKYLENQVNEMMKYKWIKGTKMGRDPGKEAITEWVQTFAKGYREEYNETLKQTIKETANKCKDDLKQKLPGVSDELWNYIFEKIIATFTEVWTKDCCLTDDEKTKNHLKEL